MSSASKPSSGRPTLGKQLQASKAENATLKAENERLKATLKLYREKNVNISALVSKYQALSAKHDQLEAQLKASKATVAALRDSGACEASTSGAPPQTESDELHAALAQQRQLQGELRAAKAEQAAQATELEGARSEARALAQERDELVKSAAEVRELALHASDDAVHVRAEFEELRAQLRAQLDARQQGDSGEAVAELKAQQAALQAQCAASQAQQAASQAQLAAVLAEFGRWQAVFRSLSGAAPDPAVTLGGPTLQPSSGTTGTALLLGGDVARAAAPGALPRLAVPPRSCGAHGSCRASAEQPPDSPLATDPHPALSDESDRGGGGRASAARSMHAGAAPGPNPPPSAAAQDATDDSVESDWEWNRAARADGATPAAPPAPKAAANTAAAKNTRPPATRAAAPKRPLQGAKLDLAHGQSQEAARPRKLLRAAEVAPDAGVRSKPKHASVMLDAGEGVAPSRLARFARRSAQPPPQPQPRRPARMDLSTGQGKSTPMPALNWFVQGNSQQPDPLAASFLDSELAPPALRESCLVPGAAPDSAAAGHAAAQGPRQSSTPATTASRETAAADSQPAARTTRPQNRDGAALCEPTSSAALEVEDGFGACESAAADDPPDPQPRSDAAPMAAAEVPAASEHTTASRSLADQALCDELALSLSVPVWRVDDEVLSLLRSSSAGADGRCLSQDGAAELLRSAALGDEPAQVRAAAALASGLAVPSVEALARAAAQEVCCCVGASAGVSLNAVVRTAAADDELCEQVGWLAAGGGGGCLDYMSRACTLLQRIAPAVSAPRLTALLRTLYLAAVSHHDASGGDTSGTADGGAWPQALSCMEAVLLRQLDTPEAPASPAAGATASEGAWMRAYVLAAAIGVLHTLPAPGGQLPSSRAASMAVVALAAEALSRCGDVTHALAACLGLLAAAPARFAGTDVGCEGAVARLAAALELCVASGPAGRGESTMRSPLVVMLHACLHAVVRERLPQGGGTPAEELLPATARLVMGVGARVFSWPTSVVASAQGDGRGASREPADLCPSRVCMAICNTLRSLARQTARPEQQKLPGSSSAECAARQQPGAGTSSLQSGPTSGDTSSSDTSDSSQDTSSDADSRGGSRDAPQVKFAAMDEEALRCWCGDVVAALRLAVTALGWQWGCEVLLGQVLFGLLRELQAGALACHVKELCRNMVMHVREVSGHGTLAVCATQEMLDALEFVS